MGTTIAAAPPPGLFFASTINYAPMLTGNGNTGCGPGCTERYNGVAAAGTFAWGTGLKFLGADYAPTITFVGLQLGATGTPYPQGGGVGSSPIYGITLDHALANIYFNPLNFSWNLGKGLYVGAGFGFVAPTGMSYAGSVVPDFWSIRPHVAVSYLGEGWNLTANVTYDINTASRGNPGTYQVIARAPTTTPAFSAFLTGPANPGDGYTSGNLLYVDWTATKKFGNWEVGPVGFLKFQTTNDSPGGDDRRSLDMRPAYRCKTAVVRERYQHRSGPAGRIQFRPGGHEAHLLECILYSRLRWRTYRINDLLKDILQDLVSGSRREETPVRKKLVLSSTGSAWRKIPFAFGVRVDKSQANRCKYSPWLRIPMISPGCTDLISPRIPR
ncbi:transporter [Bradyrhizobium sp. 2S1]|uniref:transporter n=1 Tax=Bradyrhizobium sp. 2S1 TaxID=1404429 RepID=UPI00140D0E92|nr:transporter [Bradyrhizobium sp. 2S1]MCK7672567.1 transporter [Bradyrhizobium sp. 2S1]